MNTKGKIIQRAITIIPAIILLLAVFVLSAPSQPGTLWRDNFSDSTGISVLSNVNFSTGNISLNNTPWFYPDHEYRKSIDIFM